MMRKYKLIELCNEMKKVNRWHHFVRNKPCYTSYFYHRLILFVGYDVWNYYEPYVVNAWKSAEYNFDKMYGLIKVWSESGLPEADEKMKELYEKKMNKAYEEEMKKIDEKKP